MCIFTLKPSLYRFVCKSPILMHMLPYCYTVLLTCMYRQTKFFCSSLCLLLTFYTSDIKLAHWIAKIKEPIWKMLAALIVDIVTFTTVWSMSTRLQHSILNSNKNNFKLQQKLKNFKYDHFIISVFKKLNCLICLTFFDKLCMHAHMQTFL